MIQWSICCEYIIIAIFFWFYFRCVLLILYCVFVIVYYTVLLCILYSKVNSALHPSGVNKWNRGLSVRGC